MTAVRLSPSASPRVTRSPIGHLIRAQVTSTAVNILHYSPQKLCNVYCWTLQLATILYWHSPEISHRKQNFPRTTKSLLFSLEDSSTSAHLRRATGRMCCTTAYIITPPSQDTHHSPVHSTPLTTHQSTPLHSPIHSTPLTNPLHSNYHSLTANRARRRPHH